MVIRNSRNLGFAGALAQVLPMWASGSEEPFCIVCAHDAFPANRSVARVLKEVFDGYKDIGIAYTRRNPADLGLWSPLKGPRLKPLPTIGAEKIIYGIWFPEHCFAIRRDVVEKIGIDHRLFAYYEGLDLSLSALKLGWLSALVVDAVVENLEWGETVKGTLISAFLMARNSVLLAQKHAGKFYKLLRGFVIILSALRNLANPIGYSQQFNSFARILGAMYGLMGMYGPPPSWLMRGVQK